MNSNQYSVSSNQLCQKDGVGGRLRDFIRAGWAWQGGSKDAWSEIHRISHIIPHYPTVFPHNCLQSYSLCRENGSRAVIGRHNIPSDHLNGAQLFDITIQVPHSFPTFPTKTHPRLSIMMAAISARGRCAGPAARARQEPCPLPPSASSRAQAYRLCQTSMHPPPRAGPPRLDRPGQ